ncbi:glycosyl hydrolase family 95 catalytic domain-containing protein [Pseudalkalibacillus decolorationis]|uniref:glycosyl hydrolase family 95 catalytic domain-containing protein n=1 Tax=Pseudalkalibacillus decolorationis TaxID=163879 RepID=UPI00214935B3|nr:glycoside hydrolase N-terminal domain-containing protein [Pseudalkalibacillus decolorationis]
MHVVKYDNAESSWNEALPLGNGSFGGMVFFEDNKLTIAMNHYEVYYKKLHLYSKKYQNSEGRDFHKVFGLTFDEMKQRAKDMYRDPDQGPFFLYTDALWNSVLYRRYGKPSGGASHYPTGEIQIIPCDDLAEPDHYSLQLDVEKACVDLRVAKESDKLGVRTIFTQNEDYLVTEIKQTNSELVKSVTMTVPSRKYGGMTVQVHKLNDTTFYYTGSFYPDGEDKEQNGPFTFLVMMRMIGAKGSVDLSASGMNIKICDAEETVTLVTTVVTEEETKELFETAIRRLDLAVSRLNDMYDHHQKHWVNFWKRSSITLPDKVVEDLWYVNLYAIACSSGKGGRMYQQACGLNGLWDIKQPTKWGSMWYWDVNIQAAFWPLYTANHLEIAEAFNDALLSYTSLAEKMAKQFHGLEGYSGDYPHSLYLSTWPWCAQFLWHYYQYSMDRKFLKEKAYPLFKQILRFFVGYLQYDSKKEQYVVFPDISPEQGPVTRNSTITLSAVKYLLNISIEANVLLGEEEADRKKWSELLAKLAPYPTAVSQKYGEIIKDSEWAPEDLHLRHPSLLMPIYPIGEINKDSEECLRKSAENTLRYVQENTEIGVFQFGWLSCAASRLGKGNTALRLLYEQGIDLLLRTNGLFAEETERWINYCNITNEPLYYPHMMEASGEMVASVNEMLLQSYNGVIEVFPSVPSGEPEKELTVGLYDHDIEKNVRTYDKWDDCEFHGLLAVGAFEVSAVMKNGRTTWVKIKSLAGHRIVIKNPFGSDEILSVTRFDGTSWEKIEHHREGEKISFITEKNTEYAIFPQTDSLNGLSLVSKNVSSASNQGVYPRVHEAHTYRRVFLGKNKDTHHMKMLDHFTFDYYSGNYRESRTTVYRLDFGTGKELLSKDYSKAIPRQLHMGGGIGQDFRKISSETVFTPFTGLGWESVDHLIAVDRGTPDELRRDFICGTIEKTFLLELPKGRYDMLFVSGDNDAPSYTEIEIEGQNVWKPESVLKAGEFVTDILPVTQRKDGYVKIHFRTKEGQLWKINLLILNKNYTYL